MEINALFLLLLFLNRIVDLTLSTIRIIVINYNKLFTGFIIAIISTLIWYFFSRKAYTLEPNFFVSFVYCFGYALGTSLGVIIHNFFDKSSYSVQVISNKDIINPLRDNGYAVSTIKINGAQSENNMVFIEVRKKSFKQLKQLLDTLDDKAFIVVNQTKYFKNGYVK